MTTAKRGTSPEPRRHSDWLRVIIPLLVITGIIVGAWRLGYFDLSDPERLRQTTRELRGSRWLIPAFVAAYAVFVTVAVPSTPLSYVGGALFGFAQGSVVVFAAAMLGGLLGYFLARGVMARPAERLLGRYRDKVRLPRNNGAFLATVRLHLVPVIPYAVCMYAAGISRVPVIPFTMATAVGILPGTIATVFAGSQVMAGLQGGGKRAIIIGVGVAIVLLLLSLIPMLMHRAPMIGRATRR